MSQLLSLLGKNVASPEVTAVLARYPDLEAEVQELAPDEGVEAVRYLRSEDDGLLIKCSVDGEIRTIFLMGEGKDGFTQFDGELPGHLTFDSTPADALEVFGEPAYRRPAGRVGTLPHGELLRFDWPSHSVHFQFRGDGAGVELVTAMTAKSVPGRSHRDTAG